MAFSIFKKNLIDAAAASDIQAILTLLNNKADVNMQNILGWTPLLISISKKNNQVAKLLLDFKADPNWQNSPVGTPLIIACVNRDDTNVNLLLEYQADPNITDKNGWTPLMVASQEGAFEIVSILIEKGANVNAQLPSGWTALHSAIEKGHYDIVKLLVLKGARVNSYNNSKEKTPLALAESKKDLAITTLLKQAGAKEEPINPPPFVLVKEKHKLNRVSPQKPNPSDSLGIKIFIFLNIALVILAGIYGIFSEIKKTNIYEAIRQNNLQTVRQIIQDDYDINKLDNFGETLLTRACSENKPEIVKLLLEKGADPNKKNGNGLTALQIARNVNNEEIIKILELYTK